MPDIFKSLSDKIDAFVDAHPDTLGVVAATAAKTLVDVTQGAYGVATGNGAHVADWFDSKVAESQAILKQAGDDFVDKHPNMLGVLGATALNAIPGAAMVIAKGQVDTARLGQGIKKGGWGYAEDAMRALPFLSPVSKLAKFGFGKIAASYKDPISHLNACVPISITKALAQTGQVKSYMALDDSMQTLARFPGAERMIGKGMFFEDMTGALQSIGAKFKLMHGAKSFSDLKQLAHMNRDGVTTFGVHWFHPRHGDVGHALNAFIGWGGKMKFADRKGGGLFDSLAELEKAFPRTYQGISNAVVSGTVLQIPQATWLKTMNQGPVIGLAVNAVRMVSQNDLKEKMKDFIGRQKKR